MAAAVTVAAGDDIRSDERVVVFPAAASLDDGRWTIPLRIWVFEPEADSRSRAWLVRQLRDALNSDKVEAAWGDHLKIEDDEAAAYFRLRTAAFLVDNERGKEVTLRLGPRGVLDLIDMPETASNGHASRTVTVPHSPDLARAIKAGNGRLGVRVVLDQDDDRVFASDVYFSERRGISVISDIDDTIKVSDVHDGGLLLRRTLMQRFEPVEHLASVYQTLAERGAVFHYVSASPWQLQPLLAAFIDEADFPAGTMHHRNFRMKDDTLIEFLRTASGPGKRRAITTLIERYPERQFILIGDTVEQDPQVYAAMLRRFGDQIISVFLREPDPEANRAALVEAVFEGIDPARWMMFTDPRAIKDHSAWLTAIEIADRRAPVELLTDQVPYPRGLAMVGDELFVLCRGRVRGVGGVDAAIDDQAGTIYAIDPTGRTPAATNGRIIARPTAPPFTLFDRTSNPPESDRLTDRPYCTLRWHEPTQSLYICAFSGIDKSFTPTDRVAFSKNLNDGLLRYDLRTQSWHTVERHNIEAGGTYPHHDPQNNPPPHGWLNGPDNCLPLGDWLYAVGKDNSTLVRYDLRAVSDDPEAGPPPSTVVLSDSVALRDGTTTHLRGHSALAARDDWLYLGCRTSSQIVRLKLDAKHTVIRPTIAEVVARFDPYDAATGDSPNITDMTFDPWGRLYVVNAQPARVHRFTPDPHNVYDARAGRKAPWIHLADATGRPRMKSENVLVAMLPDDTGTDQPWLFVTSANTYDDDGEAMGFVYRMAIDPPDTIASMALEMRSTCEQCGADTPPAGEAFICTYECTFCADCTALMNHVCPNCNGELVRRPRATDQP